MVYKLFKLKGGSWKQCSKKTFRNFANAYKYGEKTMPREDFQPLHVPLRGRRRSK